MIENGLAYEKFIELCASQGGDIEVVKNMDLLPKASLKFEYKSKKEGYISHLSAMDIGTAAVGGRRAAGDDAVGQCRGGCACQGAAGKDGANKGGGHVAVGSGIAETGA